MSVVRLVERFAAAVGRRYLLHTGPGDRVSLTAAGRELLPAARRFVTAADALIESRAEIRFSAYPSIVAQVMEQRSDLLDAEIPLMLVDVSDESRGDGGFGLIEAVSAGRLDLAAAPSGLLDGKQLKEAGLRELKLYRWALRVVLPDDFPLKGRKSLTPADLGTVKLAASPRGHRSRNVLEQAFHAADIALEVELESDSPEMLRSVARNSRHHAAVIPDDSFGAPDKTLGPRLRVEGQGPLGGQHSIYLRIAEEHGSEVPERDAMVDLIAKKIQAALGSPRAAVEWTRG